VPHGAARSGLPEMAKHVLTSQSSGGNVPVILLFSRSLRRRGAVARRGGRRGRGGNSQQRQRRELADLGRDRAVDLVVVEVPATPRGDRAARLASGTRGELAGTPAPGAGRSRSGSGRRSCCRRAPCDAEGQSRAAPGVGDAGGTRRDFSAVSWPIWGGILPEIPLSTRRLRRRGAVARRAGRRGRGGNSQLRQRREQADLGRDLAGDPVVDEAPATPRGGRAPRRASGTRGELAGTSAPRAGRSRSGPGRRSCCRRAPCDAEGQSRAAPGVGDAEGARRDFSVVSWPISAGIEPVIWL